MLLCNRFTHFSSIFFLFQTPMGSRKNGLGREPMGGLHGVLIATPFLPLGTHPNESERGPIRRLKHSNQQGLTDYIVALSLSQVWA
jgi:hypothetical protein